MNLTVEEDADSHLEVEAVEAEVDGESIHGHDVHDTQSVVKVQPL